MLKKNEFIAILGIFLFIALGTAAASLPQNKLRNLQVLPKDISDEKLDSIMNTYNKALGVNCTFCHTPYNKNIPDLLDYASDEKHMKEEARKMMRLTIQINKDYFYYDTLQRPEYLNVVTCVTCHRGDPFPADLK